MLRMIAPNGPVAQCQTVQRIGSGVVGQEHLANQSRQGGICFPGGRGKNGGQPGADDGDQAVRFDGPRTFGQGFLCLGPKFGLAAGEDERPGPIRVLAGKPLSNHAAQGMPDHHRRRNRKMIQQTGELVGPRIDRVTVARLLGATRAAAVVDDHLVVLAQGRSLRMPDVRGGAQTVDEDDRWAVALNFMMNVEAVDVAIVDTPHERADRTTANRGPADRYGTSSRRAGPVPFVGSVFQGQSLERNGASVGSRGFMPRFAISRSIAARPPPPSSSTSMRK